MRAEIEMMVNEFEAGRMSRRELVRQLTALALDPTCARACYDVCC
jgi:hypothetical protein